MASSAGTTKKPGTRGSTRNDANPTTGKTREELLRATISTVHDEKTAKEYLERKGLVITGEEYSPASLSMALLHLSQTTALSKVVVDGLRATALILESLSTKSTADRVAEAITNLIQPATEQLALTMADLRRTTEDLRGSAVSITRTADEFTDTTASSLQYLTDAAADATAAASEINEAVKNQAPPNPTPPTPPFSYTYAAAGAHLPLVHASTLARGDARAQQVLIDRAPGTNHNGLEELTEKELTEKARVALEQMDQGDEPTSTPIQFVGARKLRNGGVIYEMGSPDAAQWLKNGANMFRFLQVFSATSVIKQRAYPTVVEYIPLSFKPDDRNQLESVEKENSLEAEGILSARWIKPAYRRKKGQRTAHAIVGFSQPEGANSAIRNGIIIAGKRVWARKLLHEPRRCLKCQLLGVSHVAAECQQDHDTCGSCGQNHRTADCTVDNPTHYSCVNCKDTGHAAWDRHCPTFTKLSARYNAKHPENGYRFFPISSDPTTWETTTPLEENNLDDPTSVPPGDNQEAGWTTVDRQQNEARRQAINTRGRSRTGNRGNTNGSSQRLGPATGANAIAGPSNSVTTTLRQTTLPTEWVPGNQESTNPIHPQ